MPTPGRTRTNAEVSRRELLGMGVATALGTGIALVKGSASSAALHVDPFWGPHQPGIATPPRPHSTLAAFDVLTDRREDVVGLLKTWSAGAARLCAGSPTTNKGAVSSGPLSVTFGFGSTLFELDGQDRFGIAARRPPRLIAMPTFEGDELQPARTGGDLTVQVAGDDPKSVEGALRALSAAAAGAVSTRWVQKGFTAGTTGTGPPRDLLGFKDGIVNPSGRLQLARDVWVGAEGPAWLRGGSYLVARRIHIDLEAWNALSVAEQERVIGRDKASGAPLGGRLQGDPIDLSARDDQGHLLIPASSHVALAAPANYGGGMILRRSYSYDDTGSGGVDAGLLFLAYQRDPLRGFVPIFTRLAQADALRHFTVHTGGALVAMPPGTPGPGAWVGQPLFDS